MKIVDREIRDLIPAEYNPRHLSQEQAEHLEASLKRFGAVDPAIINTHPDRKNIIIGGHQRLKTAQRLGWETFPCVELELDKEKERELNIRLNKNTGGWDYDALANYFEVEELTEWGFSDEELFGDIEAEEIEAEEDDYQEPDDLKVDVVLGDLIEIGEHRLLCGDSTDSKQWERLEIKKNTICFTSPPYNAGKSAKLTGNKAASKKGNFYESYDDDSIDYSALISESLSNAIMFTSGVCYNVQPLAGNKVELIEWLNQWKDSFVDILTWDKGHAQPAMAQGVCSSTFEWLVVFNKENNSRSIPLSSWRGTVSNVYSEPPQKNNEYSSVHAATFPMHLPEFVIGKLMDKSEAVVDCFIGTGTTMVAAHQLKRKCYGMELDPKYCQVIIGRMKKLDDTLEIKINGEPYGV